MLASGLTRDLRDRASGPADAAQHPRLRGREPEGRRRQDDDRRQPQRVPRRGGRAGAAHRSRPAGERDLRPGNARERRVDARPARRRPAREAREADRGRQPRRRHGQERPRGRGRRALEPRRRRALPRRRARGRARGVLLRSPRLPAVVRPAHRQRARSGASRDRSRAGRVLRARGPLAAPRHDQSREGAAQSASSPSRGSC